MSDQLMLSSFAQKTITAREATKDFRRWNNLVIDWDVEYEGYHRADDCEDETPEGFIEFHVIVEITEALVNARDKKTYKKTKVPGYKLTITQNVALPESDWETWHVHDEEFIQKNLKKAIDAFQRELLNIQNWIKIANSRARLIPENKDAFECVFCGWVTDEIHDDITCLGCGKRFWSERLWSGKGDVKSEK